MANVAYDQNEQQETNSTNVLGNSSSSPLAPNSGNNSQQSATGYVSDGNPYGKYAGGQGSSVTSTSAPAPTARKSTSGASSGSFTNVQSYIDKNQKSSQDLGNKTANQLTNTADIAKKNLEGVQKQFTQGAQAGSLEDSGNALTQANTAFKEAATAKGPEREWNAREATAYTPQKDASGNYSQADQALINSNKARVIYGDGSVKDFDNQIDATNDIASYNKDNSGFFSYDKEQELSVNNDRLAEILNAEYKGPNELSEISGYGDAYNKFQDASSLQNQVLKGGSNNELLTRTFASPENQYNQGNKLLDDLLLGQGKANETLKSAAQTLGTTPTGKLSDQFTAATKDARTEAGTKTQEMSDIKTQAREALMNTSGERTAEVNQRVNDVIKDWEKYPQYFKDRFQGALTEHNQAAEKKKEYDAMLPEYNQAKANYNYYSKVLKPLIDNTQLESFDPQFFSRQLLAAQGQSPGVGYTSPQDQKKAQNYIRQYDGLLESLGYGGYDSTYGGVYQGGYGDQTNIAQLLSQLKQQQVTAKQDIAKFEQMSPQFEQLSQFKDYDPNALDLKLSQLEAEALGVQGGEGLYNLIKNGGDINELIKTKAANRDQLVSTDEQSQLARLESIAKLAKDYGVKGSGVNFTNQFSDRDAAGKQNATSALDTDNFARMMQGAERTFRDDAKGSNIVGSGYGQGSSRGVAGKQSAQAWTTLNQNFGDLIDQSGGYRNMYSNDGVNKDLIKQASSLAKGVQGFQSGSDNTSNLMGQWTGVLNDVSDMSLDLGKKAAEPGTKILSSILGDDIGKLYNKSMLLPMEMTAKLYNGANNFIGGNKQKAQAEADLHAQEDAMAKLRAGIDSKINTTGLKNQLSVNKNSQQDMELFKLLGMLDTTNI